MLGGLIILYGLLDRYVFNYYTTEEDLLELIH